MTTFLFVCTGNYYRSRIAEILFNHLSNENSLHAQAVSRGFRLNPGKNKGDLSPHAIEFLNRHNIPLGHGIPTKLTEDDLQGAFKIILMDEREHRPMIKNFFPEWEDNVCYWNIADDYVESPALMLPLLTTKVNELIDATKRSGNQKGGM
jgi:protein-tyrosine phosphatase